MKDTTDIITRIEKLEQKFVNPLQTAAEDAATIEAIFSILRKKCGVQEKEIRESVNIYGSVLSSILDILYRKKIATPEEIRREIIAFHHVIGLRGLNSNLTYEQITEEREKFVKELENIEK
jgi:transcription initiation factor IIE alpha subunit